MNIAEIKWKVIKKQSDKDWLELAGDDGSRTKTGRPLYPYLASCWWGGRVTFYKYRYGHGYNHDCATCRKKLRIFESSKDIEKCIAESHDVFGVGAEIKKLQEIQRMAVEHFRDYWWLEYWK